MYSNQCLFGKIFNVPSSNTFLNTRSLVKLKNLLRFLLTGDCRRILIDLNGNFQSRRRLPDNWKGSPEKDLSKSTFSTIQKKPRFSWFCKLFLYTSSSFGEEGSVKYAGKNMPLPKMKLKCPLLGIYPEETKIEKDKCIPIFTAELFTIARTWKQPRCPSTEE